MTDQLFTTNKIVPVVVINDIDAAIPLAQTLLDSGIDNMEITLRSANALKIIEKIAHAVPEMVVGAGTILNRSSFKQAMEAGAKYIVSPGITLELLRTASEYSSRVSFIPGICTPSQAMDALDHGFYQQKFFPAEPYNAAAVIKALAAVLPQVRFCPTGGISAENIHKYLALDNLFAIGLSAIVDPKLIANHDFIEIKKRCQEMAKIVNK